MPGDAIEVVEFQSQTGGQEGDQITEDLTPRKQPVRWRESVCLVAIVALCDVTIYRGQGFAGYGLLFAVAPLLLFFGRSSRDMDRSLRLFLPMVLILAARIVWCGDGLVVAVGFAVLAGTAMCFSGQRPFVLEGIVFVSQTVPAGFMTLCRYAACLSGLQIGERRGNGLAVVIPAVVLFAFSTIFVLANPDLVAWVSDGWSHAVRNVRRWLVDFGPTPLEVLFWFGTAWIAAGLLRPLLTSVIGQARDEQAEGTGEAARLAPAPLYDAFRNTLITVVILFAVYLGFEFKTLWFRVFPEGFYYSGYAHEGAAWLTVALALATFTLSAVFQGKILHDPRLAVMRRWAGVWAVENLILAAAVYHRMFIYVEFNGMTRMRMIGLLGISAVVVGFVLVLWKIIRGRSFLWLLRRDLWTVAAFAYLYAALPVDMLVTAYNVRRIMAGDPAPSVQISVHPNSTEGLLMLEPLVDCDDPIVREGVRAMLAERLDDLELRSEEQLHWTAYQIADERLHKQLVDIRSELDPYADAARRRTASEAFDAYAYQWY